MLLVLDLERFPHFSLHSERYTVERVPLHSKAEKQTLLPGTGKLVAHVLGVKPGFSGKAVEYF